MVCIFFFNEMLFREMSLFSGPVQSKTARVQRVAPLKMGTTAICQPGVE